jgi:hypothetical protein
MIFRRRKPERPRQLSDYRCKWCNHKIAKHDACMCWVDSCRCRTSLGELKEEARLWVEGLDEEGLLKIENARLENEISHLKGILKRGFALADLDMILERTSDADPT